MAAATKCSFEALPHPPYSPHLALLSVPKSEKNDLHGRSFRSNEDVIDAVDKYLGDQEEVFYFERISKLEQRWRKCIEAWEIILRSNGTISALGTLKSENFFILPNMHSGQKPGYIILMLFTYAFKSLQEITFRCSFTYAFKIPMQDTLFRCFSPMHIQSRTCGITFNLCKITFVFSELHCKIRYFDASHLCIYSTGSDGILYFLYFSPMQDYFLFSILHYEMRYFDASHLCVYSSGPDGFCELR